MNLQDYYEKKFDIKLKSENQPILIVEDLMGKKKIVLP